MSNLVACNWTSLGGNSADEISAICSDRRSATAALNPDLTSKVVIQTEASGFSDVLRGLAQGDRSPEKAWCRPLNIQKPTSQNRWEATAAQYATARYQRMVKADRRQI